MVRDWAYLPGRRQWAGERALFPALPFLDRAVVGGFSGGTLERPALKRLLADIEAGLIDVVVVHKIDRLSRSLMDFARLVEVFDRNYVTFVSVT